MCVFLMVNIIQEQAEGRRNKLNVIMKSIRNCELDFRNADEFALLSEIQLIFGCARRTALEYLDVLEGTEQIVRENGIVWTKEGYKAHLEALENLKNGNKLSERSEEREEAD